MRLLSLNLCATYDRPRKTRLQMVADFVQDNEVDVVLFQEGIRSCFVYNSARVLNNMLGGWNLTARSTFGFPLFWEFRTGIITRYRLIKTAAACLEVAQDEWLDAVPLPWRRRAVMAQVDVPDLGIVNLVSVHLTSSPASQTARNEQYSDLLSWAAGLSKADITIIGGDFNAGADNAALKFLHHYGYVQSAAAPPDYVFVQGTCQFSGQEVLTERIVSDHSGLIVEVDR